MDTSFSETTLLIQKGDGQVKNKETLLNKLNNKKVTLLAIIVTMLVIGYIKINYYNQKLALVNKVIDAEGLLVEELTPLVTVQDNNEINVEFNKVTSHFLDTKLTYLNGYSELKFDAKNEEIEIKYYENNQMVEYFKSLRNLDYGDYYEEYYFNSDSYEVNKENKKNNNYMKELHNAMSEMVNNWNIPKHISLLSIKLGSYGLTGQSSHAVRYVHMLSKHIRYLSQHQIINNLPTYFYQMVLDVNQYVLFNEEHQLYAMSDDALTSCSSERYIKAQDETTPSPTKKPTDSARPTADSGTSPTRRPTTPRPTTPSPTEEDIGGSAPASSNTPSPTTSTNGGVGTPTAATPSPVTPSPTTPSPTSAVSTPTTTASPTTASPTTTAAPTTEAPCTKLQAHGNDGENCLLGGECTSTIYANDEECSSKVTKDECLNEEFTSITNDCYSWECGNCGCGCLCQTYDYSCITSDDESTCCYLIWNWLSSCCDNE